MTRALVALTAACCEWCGSCNSSSSSSSRVVVVVVVLVVKPRAVQMGGGEGSCRCGRDSQPPEVSSSDCQLISANHLVNYEVLLPVDDISTLEKSLRHGDSQQHEWLPRFIVYYRGLNNYQYYFGGSLL